MPGTLKHFSLISGSQHYCPLQQMFTLHATARTRTDTCHVLPHVSTRISYLTSLSNSYTTIAYMLSRLASSSSRTLTSRSSPAFYLCLPKPYIQSYYPATSLNSPSESFEKNNGFWWKAAVPSSETRSSAWQRTCHGPHPSVHQPWLQTLQQAPSITSYNKISLSFHVIE